MTEEERPLFSVIIPIFNAEKSIIKCVDSVLNQDNLNYEIILIDDGSKDNSPKICDEYVSKYSKIKVLHKENGGVSVARRDGVEMSSGKYVICIDSDDWIGRNLFNNAEIIINKFNPEIIIYGFKIEDIRGRIKENNPYRKGWYSRENIETEIFPILIQSEKCEYFHPSVCGAIFNRNLLLQNMIANDKASIGEDQASIIPTIAKAKSMYIMDGCYYYYQYNRNSITKKREPFEWSYPKIVNEHIAANIDLNKFDFRKQMYRKICHDFWNAAFSQFYSKKSYNFVKKDIFKHMEEEFYKRAIERAEFKGSNKAMFMINALRKRRIFLMYLYSKIRRY